VSAQTRRFFEDIKHGEPHKSMGAVEAAREGVKEVVNGFYPGLSSIVGDIGAELKRLGVQGQMEMASAIYGGNAFVPYGPGQYTPPEEKGAHEHEQERNYGREM
jgi:hypothetical protein